MFNDKLRKLAVAAVLTALSILITPAILHAVGALVGTPAQGQNASAVATTNTVTTTAGNLLTACGVNWRSVTGGAMTLTDSKAVTWTEDPAEIEIGSFVNLALAYNQGGARGTLHSAIATGTIGSSPQTTVSMHEWSGIDTSPTVVSNSATGTSTAPSVNVTVGSASTVVACMSYDGATTTITPNSGTQAVEVDETSSVQNHAVAYKVGQTGTVTISWTLGASRTWGAVIESFTEVGGGGAPLCNRGLLGVGCLSSNLKALIGTPANMQIGKN